MSTHEPMTQERLAEARAALDEDMSQWGGEYGLELIEEVKRLQPFESIVSWRYGDTTDGRTREDMVERAARESYGAKLWDRLLEDRHGTTQVRLSAHRAMIRAALDAALGTGEGS